MSRFCLAARFIGIIIAACVTFLPTARSQTPPKENEIREVVYDIRDLVDRPELLHSAALPWNAATPWNAFKDNTRRRNAEPTEKAAQIVKVLVAEVNAVAAKQDRFDPAGIQLLNANRLVVRTSAANHALVVNLLQGLRRLGDGVVNLQAHLYEVDDAFYTKLKNAKPVDWEEEERRILDGKPPLGESLFKLLEKQQMILAGDEIKTDGGQVVGILSRHHVVGLHPNRGQVVRGDKTRQTLLEGVAFSAGIHISPDRRFVRVQLAEKASEIKQIKLVKVPTVDPNKYVDAEIPFLKETTHQQEFEIPDGGSYLVPVHYRPRSVQEKNRWWVLSITPRIIIEEEEQQIRAVMLGDVLPVIVADVLKNPRLKTTREFYGSPGDKRFTLVNSDAWTWPKELQLDAAGHQLTPAKREGQRLLGIRLDGHQEPSKANAKPIFTITLLNAGGSANGAVIGGCTIRYSARQLEKGWAVELAEQP